MINKTLILLAIFSFNLNVVAFNQPSFKPKNTYGLEKILKNKLDLTLKQKRFNGVDIGIKIQRVSGPTLYEKNAKKSFIPASTQKILTAVTTMMKYDFRHRFHTDLRHDGNVNRGVLNGNLYLIGYGDPLFSEASLEKLVSDLKNFDINAVKGDIVVVDHYFNPNQTIDYSRASHFYALSSALSLDNNSIKIGYKDGLIYKKSSTDFITISQNITYEDTKLYSGRPKISFYSTANQDHFTIKGLVTKGDLINDNLDVRISRPALYCGTRFKELLLEHGISIQGKVKKGHFPKGTTLISKLLSQPLEKVVSFMMKKSNNMVSDMLTLHLGADFKGKPGTFEKGVSVLNDFSQSRFKFNSSDFNFVDTSGLSYDNRLSPEQLNHVLIQMYRNPYLQESIVSIFPKYGVGVHFDALTLPDHMEIYCKTGTLSNRGVNTIAGYIQDKITSDIYTFVIFANRQKPGRLTLSGSLTIPILKSVVEAIRS